MSKVRDNSWISFSDVMTGLMVIFMFIAIAYMFEVKKEQEKRDDIFKDFKATKEELYHELDSTFGKDFKRWDVILDNDLSIKFTNPDILFDQGEIKLEREFKNILDVFLPKYFAILLQDKYQNKIAEIRIEGHTDNAPAYRFDKDPYIGNVKLSQLRSTEVLKYLRKTPYYKRLSRDSKAQLRYLITANGLSYGRTLDSDKQLTIVSGKKINMELSRRVEFKIVTTSDQLVEKVLNEIAHN